VSLKCLGIIYTRDEPAAIAAGGTVSEAKAGALRTAKACRKTPAVDGDLGPMVSFCYISALRSLAQRRPVVGRHPGLELHDYHRPEPMLRAGEAGWSPHHGFTGLVISHANGEPCSGGYGDLLPRRQGVFALMIDGQSWTGTGMQVTGRHSTAGLAKFDTPSPYGREL
jgi:hypothetical protein